VLERIVDLNPAVIGFRAIGELTTIDFTRAIEPQLARVRAQTGTVRLLLHLGENFTGFGSGSWRDLTDGIRHLHFYKGAVVTDHGGIAKTVNILKWTLNGHIRTFRNDEFDKAAHWVMH
jgi:hypothetical protein